MRDAPPRGMSLPFGADGAPAPLQPTFGFDADSPSVPARPSVIDAELAGGRPPVAGIAPGERAELASGAVPLGPIRRGPRCGCRLDGDMRTADRGRLRRRRPASRGRGQCARRAPAGHGVPTLRRRRRPLAADVRLRCGAGRRTAPRRRHCPSARPSVIEAARPPRSGKRHGRRTADRTDGAPCGFDARGFHRLPHVASPECGRAPRDRGWGRSRTTLDCR